MQLALPRTVGVLASRLRLPAPKLPNAVPPFSNRFFYVFSVLWIAAFALALIGPAVGLYYRYTSPDSNSQLMLGSRAGVAVTDQDATRIRFTVGPYTRGKINAGDDIVAIYGVPVPDRMPVTEQALAGHADDPAYIVMSNLLFGSDVSDVPLTLRSPDGREREVVVKTGEHHIEAGAAEWDVSPNLLSFVDLLHVITYPFLLWASWILHRRNSRDAVSSILSLAILLSMATEQPSATFLSTFGVPRVAHVALYDIGNICLLAGILLFPHGKLSIRLWMLLATLPVLLILHGDAYRAVFVGFMIIAVLMLVGCLRRTPRGDLRQQIKWALYGFASYAFFLGMSLLGDTLKLFAGSFSLQLLIEMLSGLAMGLAFLLLQVGLLVALLRYRLYDAESIISRTASFAIVTLVLGAGFAAVMEGIITQMQNIYANSQTPAAMVGAVMATVLIQPLHERVQKWAERRFHRNLLELREELPEMLRELRDTADPDEFVTEVLKRVNKGVYSIRSAFVVGQEAYEVIGASQPELLRWMLAYKPGESEVPIECDPEDPLFPLRVRVEDSAGSRLGLLLIGPRPDGSIAGGDERGALLEIAPALGRALRVVLRREKEHEELSQMLDTFRGRIERMEQRLGV